MFVRDRLAGTTERVSVATGGAQANHASGRAAISADGRLVAFASSASKLAPGDPNRGADVFVRDRRLGVTEAVSVGPGGVYGNGHSGKLGVAISANGRFVAFASEAGGLVPGVGGADGLVLRLFVRDLVRRRTELASVDRDGKPAFAYTPEAGYDVPAVSGGGRTVAFDSLSPNLVPSDTNGELDVFVRDRVVRANELVSVGPDGTQGDGNSYGAAISWDGRFVAFGSAAPNLVPGDRNGAEDVFVRDRLGP